jgi:hypothetical protein
MPVSSGMHAQSSSLGREPQPLPETYPFGIPPKRCPVPASLTGTAPWEGL